MSSDPKIAENETSDINQRIIGGKETTSPRPWLVAINVSGTYSCGGSIIHPSWILTAAHCLRVDLRVMKILAGSYFLDKMQIYLPKALYPHESFLITTLVNDIGLIEVETPFLDSRVLPIANEYVGKVTAVLFGWGRTSYPGVISNILKELDVETLSNFECQFKRKWSTLPVTEGNICTSNPHSEGGCKGDSGSPLVWNGKQIGITSWVTLCGTKNPDVFTRTYAFANWINNRIGTKIV